MSQKKSAGKATQLTPLMRQYYEIKEQHADTILLFRVGDFYETFAEDAQLLSRELGITLTRRNNGSDQTALAGFPYHALETYLPRLVRNGHRVAICEQTEDPEQAKKAGRKIVERQVTEITTPGVTLSEKLLEHKRNNYIASLHLDGKNAGVAFCDISTGEFALAESPEADLEVLLQTLSPAELLMNRQRRSLQDERLESWTRTWMEEWLYDREEAYRQLTEHFDVHSLKGFGVEHLPLAQVAAGALLHYMRETQKSSLNHLKRLQPYETADYMALDGSTRRNLELTASLQQGGSEGTLIAILDKTRTAMGGRLLRKWVMRPLRQLEPIRRRHDAVEELYGDHTLRSELREVLGRVGDLERIMSRISVGRTNARDLKQLAESLSRTPDLAALLNDCESSLLETLHGRLDPLDDLRERIAAAIVEEPPANTREGGMFREGFHEELDRLRDVAVNGKSYIARIKDELAAETGIPSLKIGYNKVFGYYIEVTNTHREKVPDTFIRKQTLVNSERYITPELKEVEEQVLTAEEKSRDLEANLFEELRQFVAGFAADVQALADAVATLDVLACFAEVSYRNNYRRAKMDEGHRLGIRQGRHPVVEHTLPADQPFIPNDIELDNESQQILMITGPNMAGKSIILRQTGLIVLLAQIGCFVPAREAQIGLVDKIFTRVGASDNLAAGESTFLVEMNEAANILNNATPCSLLLLDEVGRGTSTFDGLSIAWSLAEYLHNQPRVAARTLFATHYHELNELESLYERIRNYNVQVREHDGKVIFMRKLVPGGADHSYGIQVADMAGLPSEVIDRAREILSNLEEHTLEVTGRAQQEANGKESDEEPEAAGEESGAAETVSPSGDDSTGDDNHGTQAAAGRLTEKAGRKGAARQAVRKVDSRPPASQMALFNTALDPNLEQVADRLRAIDPDRMTPIDALTLLSELHRLIDDGK